MRTALAATIAATILTAVWTAHVLTARSPILDQSAPASSSIDVMHIMKNAGNLPKEEYDAH